MYATNESICNPRLRQSLHTCQVAHKAEAYPSFYGMKQLGVFLVRRIQNMDRGPWTLPWTPVHGPPHGPGPWTTPWTWSMDHPMDLVHGPPHGPGPWTTPNFQKEIAPVNMKIYWRSGYEKHRFIFFHQYTLITSMCSKGKLHSV